MNKGFCFIASVEMIGHCDDHDVKELEFEIGEAIDSVVAEKKNLNVRVVYNRQIVDLDSGESC